MFGQKKIVEKPKPPTKEEQLGPRPADIPNADPLIRFQILLRHSMPSVEVEAHAHDFGQPSDCDKPRNTSYTHFVVRGDTTWKEYQGYSDRTGGYTWKWIKDQPVKVVFSIRTDDIVMVAALDNTKATEVETLALERREDPVGRLRPEYATGGFVSRKSNGEINVSFDID